MKIGICAHPSDIVGFPELAFDFIEGNTHSFLVPEKPDADFEPLARSARESLRPLIAANSFIPGDLKVTGPAVDHVRLARYAENAFRRASSVGIKTIVFGSGGARQIPDGWSASDAFEQFVESLRVCAPLAEKHDVVLVVEPLNRKDCNLVNTIDEGAESVRRCGSTHVRLLADIFHMLRNGETPDAIMRHADLITHAHVAENTGRTQPGISGEDFRPFLRALKKADACRNLTIECVWSGDRSVAAGPAVRALRQQVNDVFQA